MLKIFDSGTELFLELTIKIRRGHLRVFLFRFSNILLAPIYVFSRVSSYYTYVVNSDINA